jgi:hypothetical protein
MGYKKNQYWRQEQDQDLATMLSKPNTSREWLEAYRRTSPRLRKMGESILRRYYSYYVSDDKHRDDLITDAITKLLTHGEHNPNKPKMFAYAGTTMKRYFFTILVYPQKYNTIHNHMDRNYDISDNEWLSNSMHIEPDYDWDYSERQRLLDAICAKIDKHLNESKAVKKLSRRTFLEVSKQYFQKYFMDSPVSLLSLSDYVQNNMEILDWETNQYMRDYFGSGSVATKVDRIQRVDWLEKRGVSSYIMDDDPPNHKHVNRIRRKNVNPSKWEYNYY